MNGARFWIQTQIPRVDLLAPGRQAGIIGNFFTGIRLGGEGVKIGFGRNLFALIVLTVLTKELFTRLIYFLLYAANPMVIRPHKRDCNGSGL